MVARDYAPGGDLAFYQELALRALVAKRAVVLLSGGLDSCTAAAQAAEDGFTLYALSFDYGHRVLAVPLGELGGSALTDTSIAVPDAAQSIGSSIPVTYVPARNTIFLAFATAYAEVVGANHIFIGANALDYSGYPDCRPEYLEAFAHMARLATKRGVEGAEFSIEAPLLHDSKEAIVRRALRLGAPIELTWSCYRGGKRACGTCESCTLRLRGFAAAGATDPILYVGS
jgi:7-cyano-7-deazaguanine synthase